MSRIFAIYEPLAPGGQVFGIVPECHTQSGPCNVFSIDAVERGNSNHLFTAKRMGKKDGN